VFATLKRPRASRQPADFRAAPMNQTSSIAYPRRSRLTRVGGIACALSVLTLVCVVPAVAQDPTSAQYDTSVTQVTSEAEVGGASNAPAPPSSGLQTNVVGGLPFTGLDLIALVAVALAFTSVGFALRRMTVSKRI
jgi:hypothetical protein